MKFYLIINLIQPNNARLLTCIRLEGLYSIATKSINAKVCVGLASSISELFHGLNKFKKAQVELCSSKTRTITN